MNIKYCITCQKEVPVESPIEGHTVVEFVPDAGQQEVLWCEGPFTDTPCPEVDPNWEMDMVEPTDDELFLMAIAADHLMEDFEVE